MKKVLLAGNGITAEILSVYLRTDSRYEIGALVVGDEFVTQGGISGFTTVGLSEVVENFPPSTFRVIMAMGYNDLNRSREEMFNMLKEKGYVLETFIHPDAHVYTEIPLGEGCVVLPGAVIDPNVQLGANTMVWSNVTVAHHSKVGAHCWLATGSVVSGQARILENTFLGVNSTIVNEVTVGAFNIVGAAALITRDTKAHSVYLARSGEALRYSSEEYIQYFSI
jgi:sugar O-acyltransferase (sialic acid O-acetyltransferase NeuD family)